jgi:hypothetical protein
MLRLFFFGVLNVSMSSKPLLRKYFLIAGKKEAFYKRTDIIPAAFKLL